MPARLTHAPPRVAIRALLLLTLAGLALSGCLAPPAPAPGALAALPPGEPARGRALFAGEQPLADGRAAGCNGCHSLEPGVRLYCPPLAGVAARAPVRIRDARYGGAAQSASEYLHESIVRPSAYIVPDTPGYGRPGASEMPPGFGRRASAQDLADLVAFLLTLR
jgi:nitric oxide reductase subunit C